MEVVFTDTGALVDNDEVAAEVELQQVAKDSDSRGSTGSNRNEFSPLGSRETIKKTSSSCADLRDQRGLVVIITSSIVISVAITVALIIHIYIGEPQVPLRGGAAADVPKCSTVATDIMKRGGSTVDAAIASILCDGVIAPMSSGIGGGGFMLIFDPRQKTRKAVALDFRETAPAKATANMFDGQEEKADMGNLGVAVPGLLKGLEKAHQMFGSMSWKDLVKPAADIAREGFPFDGPIADETECHLTYEEMSKNPNTKKVFTKDGRLLERGMLVKNPDLANSLDIIAEKGAKAFYDGELTDSIVNEMSKGDVKGILTREDLKNYEVIEREVLNATFQEYSVLTMPAPSSGAVIVQILKIMEGYNTTTADSLTYHRLIEAFKFAYAHRTQLGDPDFDPLIINRTTTMLSDEEADRIRALINDNTTYVNDTKHYEANMNVQNSQGTAHLSFIGPDEVMVSATLSLNHIFGSKMMTSSGILLNNHMADFYYKTNTPDLEYQANKIEPGKRPLSAMSPVILYNTPHGCKYRMALGASNGTRIITGIVQAILQNATFGNPLEKSIEMPRLHHQLYPDIVEYEGNFSSSIVSDLQQKGHITQQSGNEQPRCNKIEGLNVVQAVGKTNQTLVAHSDSRKGGVSSIF